jgi:energy-coupling factor transporter ATP-binding protein EcfA2
VVNYNDRVLVLGSTGSGKSEVLNYLAAGVACQRLILDTKDEFIVPGVEPVRRVDAIDWDQRTVHYRTDPEVVPACDAKKGRCDRCFDCLFRAAYYQPDALVIVVHELGDVCDFNAGKTPKFVNAYISKGRARRKGLWAGSQRPVTIPVRARGEAEHVFMVGERFLYPADHQAVADTMGQDPNRLETLIDSVQEQLGVPDADGRTHAYLWFDRRRRQVIACPQLPDTHRRAIDVGRALEPSDAQAASTDADSFTHV